MKKFISIIIITFLSVISIYGKKLDYKSSRVYYYLPFEECFDSRGFLNLERAVLKGCNVWIVIVLDDGDIIFEKKDWGSFQYGIIDNQTAKLTRKQSIDYLNKWINLYYNMAKNDRKYRYDGYSTPYFYKAEERKFEACPQFDLNDYMGLLKSGDIVTAYYSTGSYMNNVKKNLFITKDHKLIVLCPSDETPCVNTSGISNFNMFLKFDIEYYLPK